MKYKLIDNSFKETESSEFDLLISIPLFSVIITVLFIIILKSDWAILATLPIPLSIIFKNKIRTWFPDWTNVKDIIGTITINDTSIVSTNTEYQTKNIKAIRLHHNHIKGQMLSSKDIIHNGVATIVVELSDKQKVNIKLLIENANQKKALIKTIKAWYIQDITVKETFGNYSLKTLLLEPNRDFNDIQKIKKELNIQSMY